MNTIKKNTIARYDLHKFFLKKRFPKLKRMKHYENYCDECKYLEKEILNSKNLRIKVVRIIGRIENAFIHLRNLNSE